MGGPKHGARLSKRQRERWIFANLDYDGPYCRWKKCPKYGQAERQEDALRVFTIDHINGIASEHWFDNGQLMHWDCNNRARFDLPIMTRQSALSMNVQPAKERTGVTAEWSSKEGQRHDYQRTEFNSWLYGSRTGVPEGTREHPKGLAKVAVYAVGYVQGKLGSSVTYERYMQEDIAAGFWSWCPDDPEMVERTNKRFPFPEDLVA